MARKTAVVKRHHTRRFLRSDDASSSIPTQPPPPPKKRKVRAYKNPDRVLPSASVMVTSSDDEPAASPQATPQPTPSPFTRPSPSSSRHSRSTDVRIEGSDSSFPPSDPPSARLFRSVPKEHSLKNFNVERICYLLDLDKYSTFQVLQKVGWENILSWGGNAYPSMVKGLYSSIHKSLILPLIPSLSDSPIVNNSLSHLSWSLSLCTFLYLKVGTSLQPDMRSPPKTTTKSSANYVVLLQNGKEKSKFTHLLSFPSTRSYI